MSSSLSVYLLDVAATQALIGCRDDDFLTGVRAGFADDLVRDDEYHRYEIEEEGAPTADEALRAVVHGRPFSEDRNHAFQYGYAYRRLCELSGSFLPNDCFTPHSGDWLSTVDEGLRAMGITAVSLDAFGHGAPPAPLPYAHTPACGQWGPEAIAEALKQYEATERSADGSGRAASLEPQVVEAVTQCLDWMRRAGTRPGHGVIGFRF
ncbi:hypothetical protein ABZ172_23685 [Streptomyces sp. NPDC006296]|uniref:DUF7691 family protein n=1 Tax=Streptomyces sp. NPDC006296 TaxID=3156746 RepID=UPI0033A4E559